MSLPPSPPPPACPAGAFRVNATLCSCPPGLYSAGGSCNFLSAGAGGFGDWAVGSAVPVSSVAPNFIVSTVISLGNAVAKFTRSDAAILYGTAAVVVAWLAFCWGLRFAKLEDRRWFNVRYAINRLDVLYDVHHWTDDQQVLKKRKTEFGGTCSIASVLFCIGLLTALVYQIVTGSKIEVHQLSAASAPDLLSFFSDLEFQITAVSGMTCAHLQRPTTLIVMDPGLVGYRASPLSSYITYDCHNTSQGPLVSLKCRSCQIPPRDHYISFQFVDLPNDPASAVAFYFNLTTKSANTSDYMSFANGTIKSTSFVDDKLKTFRGNESNVLKVQLFPQKFGDLHDLKLLQPLVQDFVPGSSQSDVSSLRASLLNPSDGIVNITLYINYLSDYIVAVNKENVLSPISIIASIGGIFFVSIAVFLCFMVQFEVQAKKLRTEDTEMLKIVARRRAQKNWKKVRKYVSYTWGGIPLEQPDEGRATRKNKDGAGRAASHLRPEKGPAETV